MMVLGLDTSNYTTSAAAFDGVSGKNCSRLLDVTGRSWGCGSPTRCLRMSSACRSWCRHSARR